jgi:DNA-directed RNA polymerase subunit beta'
VRVPALVDEAASNGHAAYQTTTAGRVFFNQALPEGFGFVNDIVGKRNTNISEIVQELSDHYPKAVVAESVDQIKNIAFRFATQSGVTFSIEDVRTPPEKAQILDRYEKEAEKVEQQFKRGIITDGERRQKEVEIWGEATAQVQDAMEKVLKAEQFNPIDMMVGSGARGNMMQVKQIAGMRGLVANPRGDMIPRPIKSNFREGLSMLEYFIATPGARKGLVDTALRTADSGYLTRRLVDAPGAHHPRRGPRRTGPVRPLDQASTRPGQRARTSNRLYGGSGQAVTADGTTSAAPGARTRWRATTIPIRVRASPLTDDGGPPRRPTACPGHRAPPRPAGGG